MLIFFTNVSLIEFHIRYLAALLLFSVIDGFGLVLNEKSSLEYPVNNNVVPQVFILGPTRFLLYINDLDDIICNFYLC